MKSCEKCSENFDLGIHKPVKYCCATYCYSCVFSISSKSQNCINCQRVLPSRDELTVDYDIIEDIQQASQKIKNLKVAKDGKTCFKCKAKSKFKLPKTKEEICGKCLPDGMRMKHYFEGFKCVNGHRFYSCRSLELNEKCYLCKFPQRTEWHCFKCGIHLCQKCSDLLLSVTTSLPHLKCRCEGELLWQPEISCESCSSCKQNYSKLGRYFCGNCIKTHCFSCTLKRFNDISCFYCLKSFNIYNLPIQGSTNEISCKACTNPLSSNSNLLKIFLNSCQGNHDFLPDNSSFNFFDSICGICEKPENLLKCSLCPEGICSKCRKWLKNSEFDENGKCLKGHFLRLTKIQFLKTEGKIRRCGSCNKEINSESFHCRTCDVDQCPECFCQVKSLIEMRTKEVYLDSEGFEWVYHKKCDECCRCLTSYKNWGCFCQKSGSSKLCFTCARKTSEKKCEECFTRVDLNSVSCGHIFCTKCLISIINTQNCPKCQGKNINVHSLVVKAIKNRDCPEHFFVKLPQQGQCQYCTKQKNILICTTCNIKTCKKCKIWHIDSFDTPENFVCSENHSLKLTENAQDFYDKKGKFSCDGCFEITSGKSLHCLKCKLDYCYFCYSNLKLLKQIYLFFYCGVKSCAGKVEWNPKKNGKKCLKCTQKFKKSGLFECLKCNFLMCINCALKMKKEKCSMCCQVFTVKLVSPAMALDRSVVCEDCLKEKNSKVRL